MSVTSSWIRFGENESYSGYLVQPENGGALPAVVLIQEIWGVDAHIRSAAERFAAAGFTVLAPDLFFQAGVKPAELQEERVGQAKRFLDTLPPAAWRDPAARDARLAELPAGEREAVGETLGKVMGAAGNMASYVDTVLAAAKYLRGTDEQPRKVAALGFCLGGALTGQMAVRDAALAGAVIFYGNLPQAEQIPAIQCPVLGLFGELDTRITDQVPAFEAAMKENGKSLDYRIYAGAPHAFFNDTRSSYREEAAQDAFERAVAFLKEHTA